VTQMKRQHVTDGCSYAEIGARARSDHRDSVTRPPPRAQLLCWTIGQSATMTADHTGPDLSLAPAGPRGRPQAGGRHGMIKHSHSSRPPRRRRRAKVSILYTPSYLLI